MSTASNHEEHEARGAPAPYADTRAEDFTDQAEPVYVMVGKILGEADDASAETYRWLVGDGVSVPLDVDMMHVLQFFRAARLEHQAAEWMEWAGAPKGFLKDLVRNGWVRRIRARDVYRAALSLSGLCLVPDAVRGETVNGMVSLMATSEEGKPYVAMFISEALAAALWDNDGGLDLPAVAKKTAISSGMRMTDTLHQILVDMPMLLEFGFAHLEMVRVPRYLVKASAAA